MIDSFASDAIHSHAGGATSRPGTSPKWFRNRKPALRIQLHGAMTICAPICLDVVFAHLLRRSAEICRDSDLRRKMVNTSANSINPQNMQHGIYFFGAQSIPDGADSTQLAAAIGKRAGETHHNATLESRASWGHPWTRVLLRFHLASAGHVRGPVHLFASAFVR